MKRIELQFIIILILVVLCFYMPVKYWNQNPELSFSQVMSKYWLLISLTPLNILMTISKNINTRR